MTAFACPKCRGALPDSALDAGACPACGFALDGPLPVLAPRRAARWYALGALAVLTAGALAFAFYPASAPEQERAPEVARAEPRVPAPRPEVAVAPLPHEPVRAVPADPAPKAEPKPEPQPVKAGPVIHIDPFDARKRLIDDATAEVRVPDVRGEHEIVLTGTARVLRLGSVGGRVRIDASNLTVREVHITGDLNGDAVVLVRAPNGRVSVTGFVGGSAKLTADAPGGAVLFAASARLDGGSVVTATAKELTAVGHFIGGTKLNVTLTRGGALKLTVLDGGATVTYRKANSSDPAPTVDPGDVRGGAKVVAE